MLDFPVRSTVRDACCSPFNKHTDEDKLADDMQEDEREADDDVIDELLVSTIFLLLLELTLTDVRSPCYTRQNIAFF